MEGRLDLEKEADERYEGFDYDDVDDNPASLDESSDGGFDIKSPVLATHPKNHDKPPHPFPTSAHLLLTSADEALPSDIDLTIAGNKDADPIDALMAAEEAHEAALAASGPRARLQRRMEGLDNAPTVSARASSASQPLDLMSYYHRLSQALASNPELASMNLHAVAAGLTLSIAQPGVAKATAQTRFVSACRTITKASCPEEAWPKGISAAAQTTARQLKAQVDAAISAATNAGTDDSPANVDVAVRMLLRLATIPVTIRLLSQSDNAGKKLRKLRLGPSPPVGKAAAAVVDSWKRAIT